MDQKPNIKETCFGFTNNMSALARGRTEKLLNKLTRVDGVEVCLEKEFIYNKLKKGYKPIIKENCIYYSKKIGCYTEPKDEYRLKNEKEGDSYLINKTLYDYANYLIENDFLNEQKAESYIIAEQNKITSDIQKQKEEKLLKQKEEENFKVWLEEQIKEYNNEENLKLVKEIFLQEIGEYSEYQLKKLLVLIDNIDNAKCLMLLKGWLHIGNKTSKKLFYHITGIKLPTTNKETESVLNTIKLQDFKEPVQYIKRKLKAEKGIVVDVFYKNIITNGESEFIEVSGEPVNKYGLNMFITKTKKIFTLNEAKSGFSLVTGKNKKELFDKLEDQIKKTTLEILNKNIDKTIERFGLSPKYQETEKYNVI
jgi:hypothetical protein